MPEVVKKIAGPRVACSPRMIAIRHAAISSMKTPALLIMDISRTPSALMSVVITISAVPSTTALVAKSYGPDPSPTTWKPDQSRGRLSCSARTTAARLTIEAVSISQPEHQPTTWLPSSLDQL